jgi:N-acetylglutamate synthase-like GNAT family acetyltransferase
MTGFVLRAATSTDAPQIRSLIHQARINPMGLDWRRFVVAVDAEDRFLGCGQLKPHSGGVVELASIAVLPEYRGHGIARLIIERLVADGTRPLYLTCRSALRVFYEKWGFRVLNGDEMPRYFRRLSRLADLMMPFYPRGMALLVMVLK